jgi:hypothetical protein
MIEHEQLSWRDQPPAIAGVLPSQSYNPRATSSAQIAIQRIARVDDQRRQLDHAA